MILRLALRSVSARPVRSAVLACGFGFGIAVMAALLGVGDVILEQARAPALQGGGDVVLVGAAGAVGSARHVGRYVLSAPPLAEEVAAWSPASRNVLYLGGGEGEPVAVAVRGGIPSLERALGDPETAGVDAWRDTPADRAWSAPDDAGVLRAMDRFHPVPDAPAWEGSWAEWLYFNGGAGSARFYLTFLVGPATGEGRRAAAVILQLERDGVRTAYREEAEVDAAEVLAHAPDLAIGRSGVTLEGLRYVARVDLPGVRGTLTLDAVPGRSLPPWTVRGAKGWRSGYTVPVLSGPLGGALEVGGTRVGFDGGTGYHDHNWGFWEDVTWQWGQVAGDGLSFVWGRLRPPPAAIAGRLPALLAVLGPDGPLAYDLQAKVEEDEAPGEGRPAKVRVRGRGPDLDLTLELAVAGAIATPFRAGPLGRGEVPRTFLQMHGTYAVRGRVGPRTVRFDAAGAAETFR